MAWTILIIAGLLEIVWALALKHANGLTHLWPAVIGVGVAMISLGLLSMALRDLPVSIAYTVWVGIGTAGVIAAGMIIYGDQATPARLGFLALILVGIVGLKLIET